MASREYGVGRILVVCRHPRYKFKYYEYALGDPRNRSKYSGPPTLDQALSGHGGRCPVRDDLRASRRPVRIHILTQAEFEAQYIETKYFIISRSSLEEDIAETTAATGEAGVGVPQVSPFSVQEAGEEGLV